MQDRFKLDQRVVKFANEFLTVLDMLERNEITRKDVFSKLNEISDYENKALALGFLITHTTFYKTDAETEWKLEELLGIVNDNPKMLDLM